MNEIGITDYLKAGYWGFYLQTEEPDRAIARLIEEIDITYRPITVWGLSPPKCKECGKLVLTPLVSEEGQFSCDCGGEVEEGDNPLQPLMKLDGTTPNSVVILKNYHWYLKNAHTGAPNHELVQFIQDRLNLYKRKEARKIMIILSPVPAGVGLPSELVKEFTPLKYGLPDEREIGQTLEYIIKSAEKSDNFKLPGKKQKENLIQSAKGMSRQVVEDAFSYSLVKTKGKLDPKIVIEQKVKYLEAAAGVKYIEYKETFDGLIGCDNLKTFAVNVLSNPKAKGIILVGPPGNGKSHFCKAIAGVLRLPMFTVEMAEWFTSGYGETGQRVVRFIDSVLAVGRCVLFFDEIEKGLAGTQGGSGIHAGHEETQRALSPLLKMLSDRPPGILTLATCNNIEGVPPEYVRAGRWDTAPFYMGMPKPEQQRAILEYYKKVDGVKGKLEKMEGWSGAEIRQCCTLASLMNKPLDYAARYIVPVSKTMEKQIKYIENWAPGRTIPADEIVLNGDESHRALDI